MQIRPINYLIINSPLMHDFSFQCGRRRLQSRPWRECGCRRPPALWRPGYAEGFLADFRFQQGMYVHASMSTREEPYNNIILTSMFWGEPLFPQLVVYMIQHLIWTINWLLMPTLFWNSARWFIDEYGFKGQKFLRKGHFLFMKAHKWRVISWLGGGYLYHCSIWN